MPVPPARRPTRRLPALLALASAVCLVGALVATGPATSAGVAGFAVGVTTDGVDADPGDGTCATAGGRCTLRAAIMETNALAGSQRIVVPKATYALTVTGPGDAGDLDVLDPVRIDGRNATVRWAGSVPTESRDRIFDVFAPPGEVMAVTIDDLTIRTGFLDEQRGAGIFTDEGVSATLTVILRRLQLTDNVSAGSTSSAIGGGLFVGPGSDVDLIDSTVSGNDADRGAGIFVSTGVLDVIDSTVSGNEGRTGSAITSFGSLRVLNTTVSGNRTTESQVGGIVADGGATGIDHATIAGNGGVDISKLDGAMSVKSSIVDGTCSLVGGAYTSFGSNAESGATCDFEAASDIQDANLALKALENNGGPTRTRALGAGSDARGLATGAFHLSCGDPDQRGAPRGGDPCDSGSYEFVTCRGAVVDRVGTSARDVLTGTGQPNGFLALGGNDLVKGKGGPDRACGGEGRDRLEGGDGNDDLDGGPGRDTCVGGVGTDHAFACERETSIP